MEQEGSHKPLESYNVYFTSIYKSKYLFYYIYIFYYINHTSQKFPELS